MVPKARAFFLEFVNPRCQHGSFLLTLSDHVLDVGDASFTLQGVVPGGGNSSSEISICPPKGLDRFACGGTLFAQLSRAHFGFGQLLLHVASSGDNSVDPLLVGAHRLLPLFVFPLDSRKRSTTLFALLQRLIDLLLEHRHLLGDQRLLVDKTSDVLLDCLQGRIHLYFGCVGFIDCGS